MTTETNDSSGVTRFVRNRFDPKALLGLYTTIGIVVFGIAVWALSSLLDAVLDNDIIVRVDLAAAQWMNAHTTERGESIFYALTMLGAPVVYALTALVAIWLWRRHETQLLITWLAANLGGGLIDYVLKQSVHRTRPIYSAEFLHGQSYSFPSGHSMGSTVCYIMLAFVVVRIWNMRGTPRALTYLAALVVVGVVGFSRVYLGVHYPSDVAGGYAAGAAVVAACITAYHIARRRVALLALDHQDGR